LHDFQSLIVITYKNYLNDFNSNLNLQIIDTFLLYLVIIGILNFSFVLIQGTYPFNAFLSSFILCVGQFVLTISLRLQTSLENINNKIFKFISVKRSIADYVFTSLILHFIVFHFMN
ncbi:dolichyl-diphosphooligosaccharide-protein glycotransferase, partial [Ascoidea rubescens DSM 1968]